MIFNSVEFVFYLFFSILIFTISPARFKKITLLSLGVFWYSLWSPYWLLILSIIGISNYLIIRLGYKYKYIYHDLFFRQLVILNVVVFVMLKLTPLFLSGQSVPYASSFFMLTMIGFLVDIWRNAKKYEMESFVDFILPNFYFPTLIAGPVEKHRYLASQFNQIIQMKKEDLVDGLLIFSYGYFKIYYLHEFVDRLIKILFDGQSQNIPSLVIASFASISLVYIDFSGYCDMGRGVAKVFGTNLSINFKPFYFAKNPNDYWQRWNISLGAWVRDYVTMPLILRFGRKVHYNYILLFSFVLIGLWHGFAWHWLVFGLANGIFIILYNFLQSKKVKYLNWWGYVLALLLYLSCGFFQYHNSLHILSSAISQFNLVFYLEPVFDLFGDKVTYWFMFQFSIFILVDVLQEFRGMDFYLKFSYKIKVVALILLSLWLIFESQGKFVGEEKNYQLPVYFRM